MPAPTTTTPMSPFTRDLAKRIRERLAENEAESRRLRVTLDALGAQRRKRRYTKTADRMLEEIANDG
jgi:hypothetical protein